MEKNCFFEKKLKLLTIFLQEKLIIKSYFSIYFWSEKSGKKYQISKNVIK